MPLITVHVNGVETTKEVEPRTLLSTFIREELKLTGHTTSAVTQANAAHASSLSMEKTIKKLCKFRLAV